MRLFKPQLFTYNQKLSSDFLLNKMEAFVEDFEGLINLVSKLILMYIFKIFNFIGPKL